MLERGREEVKLMMQALECDHCHQLQLQSSKEKAIEGRAKTSFSFNLVMVLYLLER
jgi:hypothetical protein